MTLVQPDDEIPELGESVGFGDSLRNSNFGLFRTSTLSEISTVSTENPNLEISPKVAVAKNIRTPVSLRHLR